MYIDLFFLFEIRFKLCLAHLHLKMVVVIYGRLCFRYISTFSESHFLSKRTVGIMHLKGEISQKRPILTLVNIPLRRVLHRRIHTICEDVIGVGLLCSANHARRLFISSSLVQGGVVKWLTTVRLVHIPLLNHARTNVVLTSLAQLVMHLFNLHLCEHTVGEVSLMLIFSRHILSFVSLVCLLLAKSILFRLLCGIRLSPCALP